jgi:hypothetical protein
MGGGGYNTSARLTRSIAQGYHEKPATEIFRQREISNEMDPKGVTLRESRDSTEHPNSVAIIVGLDETGSMGRVPHHLVKDGLPTVMDTIIKSGVPDPQVLFFGIGDHKSDRSPFQVGQFESSDELLDKWLTTLHIEGNGGGNGGESYHLAWFFAGYRTSIDCFEKRNVKGCLFTIGDEPVHKDVPAAFLKHCFGDGEYGDYTAAELLEKAREKYNVFHIHVKETGCHYNYTESGWRELLGDNLLVADNRDQITQLISSKVGELYGNVSEAAPVDVSEKVETSEKKEELML